MKKFSLLGLFLFVFIAFTSYSKQIDANYAAVIATNFIKQNSTSLKRSSVALQLHHTASLKSTISNKRSSGLNGYYIFNFSENNGFIIVAADDKVHPILGYSFQKGFDLQKAPSHVLGWLKRYEDEIFRIVNDANVLEHPEWLSLEKDLSFRKRGNTHVAPLLKTTWNQSPLYNDSCPIDPATNTLSVTGCVATAMAQTLKYWNYPSKGAGSNEYSLSKFGTLKADFSKSVYRWSDMPTSLTKTSTANEVAAVAQLMRDCGFSACMNYSSAGSGARVFGRNSHTAEYALINNFGYSSTMTSMAKDYFLEADWINKLKAEFDQSRVVIYVGYTSDYSSGHCFMADGYDVNNYIHFNWGWGGYYDGYFTVNNLTPVTNYSFSTYQAAIFGIKPPACTDAISGDEEVCIGSQANFFTSFKGGVWTVTDSTIATVNNDGLLYAKNVGEVVLTYTLPSGTECAGVTYSKSVKIISYPIRPSLIMGDKELCQFETKKYAVDNSINGTWFSYNSNVQVSSDGQVTGLSIGAAVVTFKFGNVCYFDTINKSITVKSSPIVPAIKGLDSLCVNATAQYSNAVTGGTWSVMDPFSTVSTSGLLKGASQGVTQLVYAKKSTNGCVGKSTKSIKIKGLPFPVIQGFDSLCLKSISTYSASILKGTWSVTNSLLSTTSTGAVTAKSVGTSGLKYTVSVNGCSNSVIKPIIVKALPNAGTLSGISSFCGTASTTFVPTVLGGAWSISNGNIFSITQNGVISANNTINGTALVSYSVKAKNCVNTVIKSVSVTSLPNVLITGLDSLKVSQQATYKASVTGGSWNVLNPSIKVTSTGLVTALTLNPSAALKYQLNGSGACSGKNSIAVKYIKVVQPSLLTFATDQKIEVFPNPSSGVFNFSTEKIVLRVSLYDMAGKTIEDQFIDKNTSTVDFSHVAPGKYILSVTDEAMVVRTATLFLER